MKRTTRVAMVALAVATTLVFSSCSGTTNPGPSSSSKSDVTLKAVLWDPPQLPVYQKCAVAFKKKTGITVDLTQQVWANYWSNLTTKLAAGIGPDVYTLNVAYFPQLLGSGQMMNMSPYLKKDNFTINSAVPSNKLWNHDGKQYSLSQDQDVEGLIYNTKDIPSDTPVGSLARMTWNPTNGGTFQKTIEHLTIDKNGNRGDSPNFNKNDVKTYGFGLETGAGVIGQASWSPFALSTGWHYLNKNPFGTEYYLNKPKLVSTWTWLQKMYKDGYIAPPKLITSLGEQPVLDQNVVAMMIQGTWEAAQRTPAADKAQTFKWVQLPSGPLGHPVSITNSIGPAVNPATKHPAEAVKWAEFILSPTCANIVAASGVVIPTLPEAKTKALATLQKAGIDTQYWQELLNTPADLRQTPITEAAQQILDLGNVALEQTLAEGIGNPKKVLTKLNSDVNALLPKK